MSEVEATLDDKKAKFFEGVEQPKKQKGKSKKEVIMTWGKYKGKLVKDILSFDEKYAGWVYRQEFVKKFDDIYKILDNHFKDEPPQ
jgi:uncharacterized protein (DUF3820 family)